MRTQQRACAAGIGARSPAYPQQRGGRRAGGVPGQPARPARLSEYKGGSCAGGAGWGGNSAHCCRLPPCRAALCGSSTHSCRCWYPPARRYDTGSTYPAGQLLPVSCTCWGAPCGLRAAAARSTGAAATGWRSSRRQYPAPTAQRGGCRGGRTPLRGCMVRSNEREGERRRRSPSYAYQMQTGLVVGQSRACPRPAVISPYYRTLLLSRGVNTGAPPLYPARVLDP